LGKDILHSCEYCDKLFKSDRRYEKHTCSGMKRDDEFNSTQGQSAWNNYKSWMRYKKHHVPSSSHTFKKSTHFTSFFNFAKFLATTCVTDVDIFIKLMVSKRISPKFWTHPDAYGKYLNHLARDVSTPILLKITIGTLLDIADIYEIASADVFDKLTPADIIDLLQTRQISPCVLLHSSKFAHFYKNKPSGEQKIIIGYIINTKYWNVRFKTEATAEKLIKECVAELGI